jgi:hypothetical protein
VAEDDVIELPIAVRSTKGQDDAAVGCDADFSAARVADRYDIDRLAGR